MLRTAAARSKASLERGVVLGARRQWLQSRNGAPLVRSYADSKLPVLPGSQTTTVAGVPEPPILHTPKIAPIDTPPVLPPTPSEVGANTPAPPTPAPKKKRRSFRSRLFTLIVLAALGYGGGVYYSLQNDSFHDIFTDYVPFAEDVVGYFEELEFKKRFPPQELASKIWPQPRGENKVTIARQSGVNARVADPESSETSKASIKSTDHGLVAKAKEAAAEVKGAVASKSSELAAAASSSSSPSTAGQLVDHVAIPEGTEPAVQELVKLVNNVITVLNATPDAPKYSATVAAAKDSLNNVIAEIRTLKAVGAHDAETKIKEANVEFDTAAKELVRRVETELHEQETRWREEFENEREALSRSYQQKLAGELDAAKKVADEKNKNALLEQEIALQKKFLDGVKSKIDEERNGRLAKLDELSASVDELEQLTGQWNQVVDATLKTQHLQVALEAVRNKLRNQTSLRLSSTSSSRSRKSRRTTSSSTPPSPPSPPSLTSAACPLPPP